jgi:glycosyltransferase involved in cell wall biosynthesis
MRILLASSHQFPASGKESSGRHPREYPSGSGYHLHDLLAKGLAEEGHEVFYYLPRGAECALPRGVNLVTAPIPEIDLYHSPIGAPGFAETILQFAADRQKPCLLTCHMKANGTPAAPNWIFVSHALARTCGSSRVVLNGIDPGELIFSAQKEDYLLFIGAMNRAIEKGLDLALSVARSKRARLVVAGTGLNYQTIEQVAALCDEAGAEYFGDVRGRQKAELIAGARAVLFPSRLHEGCPLVILEAMFSGTPVISSRGGGSVELVTPETGILCDDEDEWIDALDRLDEISPVRCREVAFEKYHYRRMVRDYLAEYRQEIESFSA